MNSFNHGDSPVLMIRDDLSNIPAVAPPSGYFVRRFKIGDEDAWMRIHLAADLYTPITGDLFAREFECRTVDLQARQLYAVDQRENSALGTVTAWFPTHGFDPTLGRVHWLAVVPGRQRQGIGAALLAAALVRLDELGYRGAYLTTDSVRRDALRLYRRFGFRVAAEADIVAVS